MNDPLVQLEVSKPVTKDLFRDMLIGIKCFKYQITLKGLRILIRAYNFIVKRITRSTTFLENNKMKIIRNAWICNMDMFM